MSEKNIASHLAENPRLIGVLFAIFLLMSQVGTVAAGSNGVIPGP